MPSISKSPPTIITKRFNRNSVAQSHEYDHRSLADDLAAVDIPDAADAFLSGKAKEVFKMISAGRAHGPVVSEFRRIQVEDGDDAAFEFLAAEADGFHTTPYGHCVNSFTVEPCPKSLECFNECRHLVASRLPEHRENLEKLQVRFSRSLAAIDNHPAPDGAKENMKQHARQRLHAIERILATEPGANVFPEGADFFKQIASGFRGPFNDE